MTFLGFLRNFGRVLPAALLLTSAGCGDDAKSSSEQDAVAAQYVQLVRATYDDTVSGASALRDAVKAFVAAPSEATLKSARDAWIAARPAYLQSEAFRFYEGPIDDPETGPEGRINAWPLDEAFIDYVVTSSGGVSAKGIINDRDNFPEINQQVIEDQNENGSETNIAAGYHAIEFLLWGQDLSDSGPGARPYTDYVPGKSSDAERRGQYLVAAAELLVSDLSFVRKAWNDGEPYTQRFLANDDGESLKNIITGIAYLANDELAAERIAPAYETQDQEDEHSCFSDTTDQDMKFDVVGIENVYLGRYGSNDGKGLEDLVRAKDSALDTQIKSDLAAAKAAVDAIPAPFDNAIANEASRKKVKNAIEALEKLNVSLSQLSDVLEL